MSVTTWRWFRLTGTIGSGGDVHTVHAPNLTEAFHIARRRWFGSATIVCLSSSVDPPETKEGP